MYSNPSKALIGRRSNEACRDPGPNAESPYPSYWRQLGKTVASLGDGLLILGIFATGWIALGQQMWFVHPGVQGYGVMLTTGLVIGGVIEWVAVHLMGRWMYTAQMPRVPGLAIGVVPVAQMLVLPPLLFRLVAVWCGRTSGSS